MSDAPQGPGWWQASDGKWYPPEQFTGTPPTEAPTGPQSWSPDAVYQSPAQAPYGQAQAPYGQAGYGYGAMPPKNESLAVISLVLGICSIVFGCCFLGLPLGIPALITGYQGREKIDRSNGSLTGSGLALAGMICGGVGIGLGTVHIILLLIG